MAVEQINKYVNLVPKFIFEYKFPPYKRDIEYAVRDTRHSFALNWKVKYVHHRNYPLHIYISFEPCDQKDIFGKITLYHEFNCSQKEFTCINWNAKNFPREFKIETYILDEPVYASIEIVCNTHCDLQKNLNALIDMNVENWSDVTFLFGDQKFKAHKAILAARSPVFAKMFQTDMLEKSRNEIEIHDDDPQAFKQMLGAIYAGPYQQCVADNAKALLILADKYQLDDLKIESSGILKNSLKIDNVIDMLIFGDQCNAKDLTTAACEFFVENRKIILQNDSYKQIFDSKYFNLIDKIFHVKQ